VTPLIQFLLGSSGMFVATGTLLMGIASIAPWIEKWIRPTSTTVRKRSYLFATASVAVSLILFLISVYTFAARVTAEPAIRITAPPGSDPELRNIAGIVGGVGNVERYKVVVYAKTDRWYVQPFASQPMTDINSNGAWFGKTHIGSDYAALVVTSDYKPEPIVDALPSLGSDVISKTSSDQ